MKLADIEVGQDYAIGSNRGDVYPEAEKGTVLEVGVHGRIPRGYRSVWSTHPTFVKVQIQRRSRRDGQLWIRVIPANQILEPWDEEALQLALHRQEERHKKTEIRHAVTRKAQQLHAALLEVRGILSRDAFLHDALVEAVAEIDAVLEDLPQEPIL